MSEFSRHQVVSEIVNSHLSTGKQIRFWVISNSMHPLLKIGDAAIAETVKLNALKLGDIIVIQRKDDFLTHRLVRYSQGEWLSKGDNNIFPDKKERNNAITGRVIDIQRDKKSIDLRSRKWQFINPLMARASYFEWRSFLIHRTLRLPFRLLIKIIQKLFMD
jgi:signal peptidase I